MAKAAVSGRKRTSSRTGATLAPMKSADGTRDFILGQLVGVTGLTPKAMFGGLGLYAGDVFFALVARDALYLKVGDANREMFEAAGSRPFKPYRDRPMTMRYWNVPPEVLEDADELLRWAKAAIAVARAEADTPNRTTRGTPRRRKSGV
ncbi:MAG: TfoX/Sxy family protein [Vicinamibacterales bacterium]